MRAVTVLGRSDRKLHGHTATPAVCRLCCGCARTVRELLLEADGAAARAAHLAHLVVRAAGTQGHGRARGESLQPRAIHARALHSACTVPTETGRSPGRGPAAAPAVPRKAYHRRAEVLILRNQGQECFLCPSVIRRGCKRQLRGGQGHGSTRSGGQHRTPVELVHDGRRRPHANVHGIDGYGQHADCCLHHEAARPTGDRR
eukprot:scaffold4461_cov135-Isochrysis_galbana.AAC.1